MSSFIDYIKQVRGIRKVLMAGAGGVGKTSIVKALYEGKSLEELVDEGINLSYHRTLYLNLITIQASKLVESFDHGGKLIFFDLAGQLNQPLHAIRDTKESTMGGVDLIMLVFDGSNVQSLFELSEWISIIKEIYVAPNAFPDLILIKNKTELPSNIGDDLVKSFLESEGKIVKYFEISTMVGKGFPELQNWLINYFYRVE
jgi:GTPase SAR1 family protein